MPIFEFECLDCQHKFEQLIRSNQEKMECPACGGCRVEKLFSAFGFSVGGTFVSSSENKGCSSCSSHNCSSCH